MTRKIAQRGLDSSNEQDPRHLLRDTRTLGQRMVDFFSNPTYCAVTLACIGSFIYLYPLVGDLSFIIGLWCFGYTYTRKLTLPFRMPKRSQTLDYNDIKPGGNKANKARGICLFGNSIETNEELWFNNDDMRTHVLIFGSTGSGKTEALISLAFNSLIQGSGFIYVDGKGDNSLYSKVFSMVRFMAREDDILIINFMTGARDIVGPQQRRLSNTMNPFANGSSSMLSQLVVSLMDSGSSSGDGDMWKGRAIAFVEALMKVLVYARDKDMLLLDANTIRNFFLLERLEAIVMDKVLIRDNQEPASLLEAPDVVLEPMNNYLYNLPGYDKARKGKQVSQVLEQHGFITMQLTRVFSSLADTYGHILRTKLAEVDVKDVVLNRRILVVLLPALEKSPDELANLGKVIVASLKAMMAAGLGEDVEGDYRDVIQRKPTNSPTPFLCIMDEYGYYAVPGFAVVPAQAKSLGFSAIFAGQDLPAFQKASKEEAASIGANTNIKICMKLEDPIETWEFFMKTAGEAYVTKVDHFQTDASSLMNHYLDTKSASFEKRQRIDLLDLKEQREGQAHIFFKSTIVRANMFFANPPPVKEMRLNHFLKVEPPKTRVLVEMENRLIHFKDIVDKSDFFMGVLTEMDDISFIANHFAENDFLDPIERGVSALMAYQSKEKVAAETVVEIPDEVLDEHELNLFTKMRVTQEQRSRILVKDLESFGLPLLQKMTCYEQIQMIERLSGRVEKHAQGIAEEIVKDMAVATMYPPEIMGQPSGEDLANIASSLTLRIKEFRSEQSPD